MKKCIPAARYHRDVFPSRPLKLRAVSRFQRGMCFSSAMPIKGQCFPLSKWAAHSCPGCASSPGVSECTRWRCEEGLTSAVCLPSDAITEAHARFQGHAACEVRTVHPTHLRIIVRGKVTSARARTGTVTSSETISAAHDSDALLLIIASASGPVKMTRSSR